MWKLKGDENVAGLLRDPEAASETSPKGGEILFSRQENLISTFDLDITISKSQYDFRFAQNKSARSALMCPARRRSRYLKGHYLVLVIIIVIAIIMMIIIVVAIVMTIMIIVANKQEIIIVVPICNLQWSGVQRDSSPSCPRGV